MARRKVDTSMLEGLLQGAESQEITRGARTSIDPKFPAFTTPVNEDILVYIPRTNMVTDENGETMKVLTSHIHDYKVGQSFGKMRCINGLSGNQFFDELGYDGTCPACEAVAECWELYNKKLASEAQKLGIDPQNDPSNVLKTVKATLRQEMDMKNPDEYVTFPIVIIPQKGKMIPADDAAANLKPVFVTWRRQRYEDSIISALDALRNNPGHPAGMFWFWKFSYNTEGKQPTAMLSAKNAKYSPITDASDLAPLAAICEEAAKEFTLVKAAEVLVANQFMYKEDMVAEVSKVMAKTRSFLELVGAADAPALEAPQAAANPLASFANAPKISAPVGDLGAAAPTQAPAGPQVQAGSPVSFGM